MKNTFKNYDKPAFRCINLLILESLLFIFLFNGKAFAIDECRGISIPNKHFIYLADVNLRELKEPKISLGDVELPSAQVKNPTVYVISSKDLLADSSLGGKEISVDVQPTPSKCNRVNLSRIIFNFDSSPIPPWTILDEHSIFWS